MKIHEPTRLAAWLVCSTLTITTSGCSTLLNAGLQSLAGEGRPEATHSVYEVAPTNDWQTASLSSPYKPTQSLFNSFGSRRVACQAIPVGMAQIHSVPTGPAATPLLRVGFLELGIAGPGGAVEDVFARDSWSLTSRAFRSGARIAGIGPTCGNRLFYVVRLGSTGSEVSVLR